MKASRDRERKRAGKDSRPQPISDAEYSRQLAQFCHQAHRENTVLLAQLQRQRQALLQHLGRKEVIQ